jgi:hypothetical protein
LGRLQDRGEDLQVKTIDDLLTLSGDEDTGVGINCRRCDRGGLPIAYYIGIDDTPYADTDVFVTKSMIELIGAGINHVINAHGAKFQLTF